MKIIPTLLFPFLLFSCSVNKIFLRPTKIEHVSSEKEKFNLTVATRIDTAHVLIDSKTLQPTFLNSINDTINQDYTIESVVFESLNGNKLNGWLIKPKNATPTITLLHFHGNAGFIYNQYHAMTPFLKLGYQAFVFDYSGFGFSEGKASRKNVLIDGNSALTYIKSRDDVKNTKVVIYGQSLGGHLSAVVAQQRQAEIDGLVIEGAFSSHQDIAALKAGIVGRLFVSEQYSAKKSIRDYKKPVLVIHSTEDQTIPFELGQRIYSNANFPKEFYEIEKCHICGPHFYAELISAKIMNMLNN